MPTNPDRLTGLDSSFLHLEDGATHMHVAGAAIFEGRAPAYDELIEHILSRLHLVPRYRQRLAFVPFGQGRPVWVDDPHFNVAFHVRHTALPSPGGDEQLKRLCGRIFSQALDRSRPMWELWLVEGLSDDRFALLSKTHHALVDGISGVDIVTVLFDTSPEPAGSRPSVSGCRGRCRPMPSCWPTRCWNERPRRPRSRAASAPRSGARARSRPSSAAPLRPGRGCAGGTAHRPAEPAQRPDRTAPQVHLGARRSAAVQDRQERARRHRQRRRAGGGRRALGRYLRRHDEPIDDTVLRAMVPVSVRADVERGALGNRVAAMWAALPIGETDPITRLQRSAPR